MFHRSERLFLRPAWREDATAVHHQIGCEEIVRNLATAPWPYGLRDAERFVTMDRPLKLPSFLITLPGEGIVGSAGLGIDAQTGLVQAGYWIGRRYWGLGFATEAARAVLRIAKEIGHRKITASHFVDNPASGKVLRKAGFRPTGTTRLGYSLARGGSDPVACFEMALDAPDAAAIGGAPNLRQAA